MRRTLTALIAAGCVSLPGFAADDEMQDLKQELRRLAARVEALEKENRAMQAALATERLSENEPEIITRLKGVEFQTLAMQKQARQVEALEGVSVGASLTGVMQRVAAGPGQSDARSNYRGDISLTLPGGEWGAAAGKLFAHLRLGQGKGLSDAANSTAFQVGDVGDNAFGILAQAWWQMRLPLPADNEQRDNARTHLHVTVGKIDPFVFFDQNRIADDETTRFINKAFVHNPLLDRGGETGADRYGFAPGAIAQYVNERDPLAAWSVSLGVFGTAGAASEQDNAANFNGTGAGPLVLLQADAATRFNYLPGNYRAYLWRNGRGVEQATNEERPHQGLGFSVDQQLTETWSVFARYGRQIKGDAAIQRALTAGFELSGDGWGRAADRIGLALGGLRFADGLERDAELYYRYPVNKHLEFSPHLQWLQRPGGDMSATTQRYAGLRMKVGY